MSRRRELQRAFNMALERSQNATSVDDHLDRVAELKAVNDELRGEDARINGHLSRAAMVCVLVVALGSGIMAVTTIISVVWGG